MFIIIKLSWELTLLFILMYLRIFSNNSNNLYSYNSGKSNLSFFLYLSFNLSFFQSFPLFSITRRRIHTVLYWSDRSVSDRWAFLSAILFHTLCVGSVLFSSFLSISVDASCQLSRHRDTALGLFEFRARALHVCMYVCMVCMSRQIVLKQCHKIYCEWSFTTQFPTPFHC